MTVLADNDASDALTERKLYMGERRLIPLRRETVIDLPPCGELNNSLQMRSIGFSDEHCFDHGKGDMGWSKKLILIKTTERVAVLVWCSGCFDLPMWLKSKYNFFDHPVYFG